jgi:hypothetical protein
MGNRYFSNLTYIGCPGLTQQTNKQTLPPPGRYQSKRANFEKFKIQKQVIQKKMDSRDWIF